MAIVDLVDLVADLKSQVNPPGSDLYPDASEDDWVLYLRNGFWDAYLDGVISTTFTEFEGEVRPVSGTSTFTRDLQQIAIFYASMRIIENRMTDVKTAFRAKAGPVSYETEQSAQVLKAVIDSLRARRNLLLSRLSDGGTTPSYVFDGVIARTEGIIQDYTHWYGVH